MYIYRLLTGLGESPEDDEMNEMALSSRHRSQYCGEPPWPRGSVLGLRPPGLEFRILCLEDSVISIISPSSGGSPAQFSLYVHKGGRKPDSFHFQTQDLKFEPWLSEAEHVTSRSRRLPTKLHLYECAGKNILFLWNIKKSGVRTLDHWKVSDRAGSFNHCTRAPALLYK